ncbi:MAG: hypothetical protein IPN69_19180 [Acidobacteria bacterium]|nr:hypothetical protein [Acidobacteriota bacterium]MBK8812827.1 hypothetical protein [Acidobacteriota bacterium]MBK8812834.1 hypothetical protein [Acidobacteriota bacterium]
MERKQFWRVLPKMAQNRFIRVGVGLGIILLIVFVLWIGNKEITPENFYFQPFLVKAFVVINLPAIFLAGLPFGLAFGGNVPEPTNWLLVVYYGFLICCYLAQWAFYGLIVSLFRRAK